MAQQNETDIEIAIEPAVLAQALIADSAAMKILADAIRLAMTNDVRNKGNLFGVTAQKQLNNQTKPPTLQVNTTRRVQ